VLSDIEGRRTPSPDARGPSSALQQWKAYLLNPACLASFSLALLYFTVLGFGSQLTTYLLTLGFTSTHIAFMRLVSVITELSATCAAPLLMRRIGAVRAGLWFINYQLITVLLGIALFTLALPSTQTAGLALVAGVTLSRLGLWGFDLCVQYLVQADAPEAGRGSFSSIEASLQNLFELCSFATTMVWARPAQFRFPVWVSGAVVAVSAACFAAFVRGKRGHLLHTSRCLEKRSGRYKVLPTIEEENEVELEDLRPA
jgi:iron-regulated transporter 1